MRYRATFHGRLKGAIGISYRHVVEVEGNTPEEANLALYETHDHVHGLTLTPLDGLDRWSLPENREAK
jgi:hypothetical protein